MRSISPPRRSPSCSSWKARGGPAPCCRPANSFPSYFSRQVGGFHGRGHGSFAAAQKLHLPANRYFPCMNRWQSICGYVDCMSEKRQNAAVQQEVKAGNMAIGEFGGAPAAMGNNAPMYAAPAYWLYE